jgi:hypothetical protein
MADYTMSDLILSVLPRAGRLETDSGITIYGAASSIQSIIAKRLLDRKSDLLATGDLNLSIAVDGYSAALPAGFIAMAEKPSVADATDPSLDGHQLRPIHLDADEHDDPTWWEWYGTTAQTVEIPALRPRTYKIIGTTMYVRPKLSAAVTIRGKYFALKALLTAPTSVIPWGGIFDEVFRQGVIRILAAGDGIPEQDLEAYIFAEVDTVVNARMRILTHKPRVSHKNFL